MKSTGIFTKRWRILYPSALIGVLMAAWLGFTESAGSHDSQQLSSRSDRAETIASIHVALSESMLASAQLTAGLSSNDLERVIVVFNALDRQVESGIANLADSSLSDGDAAILEEIKFERKRYLLLLRLGTEHIRESQSLVATQLVGRTLLSMDHAKQKLALLARRLYLEIPGQASVVRVRRYVHP